MEVGALAVRKDKRALKVSWGLYKAMLEYSLSAGLQYAVIGMDASALRSFERMGWHIVQIGEPMDYMGSETIPCILPIQEQPAHLMDQKTKYAKYLAA
jgi:N-acyl-L-homoserine lactone synthetase